MDYQYVYILLSDKGDGICSVEFYRGRNRAEAILEDESLADYYWPNEGSIAKTLRFPKFLDLEYCGFVFSD